MKIYYKIDIKKLIKIVLIIYKKIENIGYLLTYLKYTY